jgi:hypothetical protein
MSKSLAKYNFPGEFKSLQKKVKVLGRTTRILSKHKEVNTTGLSYPFSTESNVKIDKEIEGPCGNLPTEELDGILISDPTNNLVFIRQNSEWKKVKVE